MDFRFSSFLGFLAERPEGPALGDLISSSISDVVSMIQLGMTHSSAFCFFDLGPGLDFFFSSFFGISIEMSSSSELSYLITFLTSVSGSTFRFFDLGPGLDEPEAEFSVLISFLSSSTSCSALRFFDLGPALDEPVAEEFSILISVLISVLTYLISDVPLISSIFCSALIFFDLGPALGFGAWFSSSAFNLAKNCLSDISSL